MLRFRVLLVFLITLNCVCVRSQLVRERTALMNRYILHQNFTRCTDVKLNYYETCEIRDEDDDLVTKRICGSENQQCSDGTYNKTCMILEMNEDGSQSYTCSCHDQKKAQVSTVKYLWSRWEMLEDSRSGLYREIYDELITGYPALIKEYRWV